MRKRHPAEYPHAMSYPGYGKGMYGDDEGDYNDDDHDDEFASEQRDVDEEMLTKLAQPIS